ncbi:MAG: methylthioribulose 1-phosphate dehydratase [Xanthomonadales bacterium]|nr:methylthioribulose 1-phosphate dehydratase [Xanthomonadales bacterium]MCE7929942.1 methylthioribulose 1-phosphate dehydratase [Xanthomonadales bacterium PRO6]
MTHHSDRSLTECAAAIVDAGHELAARGWTPATSSNFSMRMSARRIAATVSGRDKGRLAPEDIMVCDLDGRAVDDARRPSAEILLHCQVYRRYPHVGVVLHTHSPVQTLASRLWAPDRELVLAGYELLKAFDGYATHEARMLVPVFPNSQDMHELARRIDSYLDHEPRTHGYLIDGHGIYTWGSDMAQARRHLDAFEFLLHCELEMRKLQR